MKKTRSVLYVWYLGIFLLLSGCKTCKKADDTVKVFQNVVSFEQVAVGDTVGNHFISVYNTGDNAVTVGGVEAEAPFSANIPAGLAIPPGGQAELEFLFAPKETGSVQKEITIALSNGNFIKVKAQGTGVQDQDSPPSEWLEFSLEQGPKILSGDTLIFHNTLTILPNGPVSFRHKPDKMTLRVTNLPPAVALIFPQPEAQFGALIIRHFELRVPLSIAPDSFRLNVNATLLSKTGNMLFEYVTSFPISFIDLPKFHQCKCPDGTSAPVNVVINSKIGYFPDSPIPAGDGPGATAGKVASVLAQIEGPDAGQCCKPNAFFRFTMRISSDFALPGGGVDDNDNTAQQLIRVCRGEGGRSLLALTKGVPHGPVTSAPGSAHACPAPAGAPALPAIGAAIGNIILQTTYDVPIFCPPIIICPCFITENDYFTQLFYFGGAGFPAPVFGAGVGGIEVHWRVTLTPGDGDCVIGARTATVKRLIFRRGADIYSPDQHDLGWVLPNADPDGDGKNNYRELLDGTNPNN